MKLKINAKKLMESFLVTVITIHVGQRIIKGMAWECRKEILDGKGLFYRFNWYISHFLS